MEETLYTVTLADGTKFENLKLNGNNFVSSEYVAASVFEGNCSPVVISTDEGEETHEHMELVQVTMMGSNEYWFILRDLTAKELEQLQIEANIEYLAMMTGVEL